MNIREQIAYQETEKYWMDKVRRYGEKVKKDKHFPFPFQDAGLVRAIQDLMTTSFDDGYAAGYNDALFVKKAKENRKNVTKHSMP